MDRFLKDKSFLIKAVLFILLSALVVAGGIFYWKSLKAPAKIFGPSRMVLSQDENLAYIASFQGLGVFDNTAEKLSLFSGSFSFDSEIVSDSAGRIYIADRLKNAIFVYQNNNLIKEIAVGVNPKLVFINNKTNRLFVYNKGSRDLSVVDLEKYEVLRTIDLKSDVFGGALDENSGKLYLIDSENSKLIVIDSSELKIDKRIDIGPNSYGTFPPAYDDINHRLYFVSQDGSKLWIIDTKSGSVVNSVKVPSGIQIMTLNQQKNKLYMASGDQHAVSIFNTKDSSVKKIPLSPLLYPEKAVADEKNGRLYVFSRSRVNEITVLDMNGKVLDNIPLGYPLSDFQFSAKTETLYALSRAGGFMMTIKSGGEPKFIYKKPEIVETKLNWPNKLDIGGSKTFYVLSDFSNNYLAFEPKSLNLNGNLVLGGGPYSTIFTGNPKGGTYIINKGINEIWHLNPTHEGSITVAKKISINKNIFEGTALAPLNKLYIATENSLIVVDGDKDEIIKTIALGGKPDIVGVDQDAKKVIVKIGDNLLGVINGEKDEFGKLLEIKNINKAWFDKLNSKLFVLSGGKALDVIDINSKKIVKTASLSETPAEMAVAPWVKKIYLLSGENKLSVLDSNSFKEIASIDVNEGNANAPQATAIYPDEKTNKIYLAHRYGQITVIDASTNKIVSVIQLPYAANPVSLKTDPDNNRLYVANKWLNQVQVYSLTDYTLQAEIDAQGKTHWLK